MVLCTEDVWTRRGLSVEPQDAALRWDMERALLMPLVEFSRVKALGW